MIYFDIVFICLIVLGLYLFFFLYEFIIFCFILERKYIYKNNNKIK